MLYYSIFNQIIMYQLHQTSHIASHHIKPYNKIQITSYQTMPYYIIIEYYSHTKLLVIQCQ